MALGMMAHQRSIIPQHRVFSIPIRCDSSRRAPASRPVQQPSARKMHSILCAASRTTPSGAVGEQFFATDQRPVILFDGVCNLCNGGVNFMLDWDKEGRCRFAALQSDAGRQLLDRSGRAPDDISSIVFVEPGGAYIKSEAILRIAMKLEIPFPLLASLGLLFPLGFRDGVYDQVADNRYKFFGLSTQCRLGDDRFNDRFLSS